MPSNSIEVVCNQLQNQNVHPQRHEGVYRWIVDLRRVIGILMIFVVTIIIIWAIVVAVFITTQFFIAALLLLFFICFSSISSYFIDRYVYGY